MNMRTLKSPVTAAFVLLTLVILAPGTQAKAQGPAYLHAISDLRSAREYLQRDASPEREHARHHAIDEITAAIQDIKVAAADDGKNPWRTPPPQSGGDPDAPIHTAIRLLKEARSDVDHGRDMPQNNGLRERSVDHIDKALRELQPWFF